MEYVVNYLPFLEFYRGLQIHLSNHAFVIPVLLKLFAKQSQRHLPDLMSHELINDPMTDVGV